MPNGFCIVDKDKMTLRGGPIDSGVAVLEIRVTKCKENCKSNEEIETYLSQNKFTIVSQNIAVDYENIPNPL